MRTFRPDIVGYSIMTYDYPSHVALNRELKKEFPFSGDVWGIHPTFSPQMIEGRAGVRRGLHWGRRIGPCGILPQVPGKRSLLGKRRISWVRHEGEIHRNALMPLAPDLDIFPVPDHRVLYDGDPYLARMGWKIFMASRGCPHRCSYWLQRPVEPALPGQSSDYAAPLAAQFRGRDLRREGAVSAPGRWILRRQLWHETARMDGGILRGVPRARGTAVRVHVPSGICHGRANWSSEANGAVCHVDSGRVCR